MIFYLEWLLSNTYAKPFIPETREDSSLSHIHRVSDVARVTESAV